MPVKFKQCGYQKVNEIAIPDATPTDAGVMSATDKAKLDDLTSSQPPIPETTIAITNGVPASMFVVDMSLVSDRSFACKVFYAVEVQDASNTQIRSGDGNANIAQSAAGAIVTSQSSTDTSARTAGSLTVSFSWSILGSLATFQVTATSSLTPTLAAITFYVPYSTHSGAISLP